MIPSLGEDQADNLMEVWSALDDAQRNLEILDFGGMLRFGDVLNRWITRPMVPYPEELTAADFVAAIHQAQGVCLLPFGILEKHGPHMPLGTDLINARWVALHGAAEEYAVVFPAYYFGQIDEARHEPGTVAYSRHMQLDLLQETTDEMARNGCKKVLIVNGHGGNLSLLPYFAQTELQEPHDYVVYVYWWDRHDTAGRPKQQTTVDMHAGE